MYAYSPLFVNTFPIPPRGRGDPTTYRPTNSLSSSFIVGFPGCHLSTELKFEQHICMLAVASQLTTQTQYVCRIIM